MSSRETKDWKSALLMGSAGVLGVLALAGIGYYNSSNKKPKKGGPRRKKPNKSPLVGTPDEDESTLDLETVDDFILLMERVFASTAMNFNMLLQQGDENMITEFIQKFAVDAGQFPEPYDKLVTARALTLQAIYAVNIGANEVAIDILKKNIKLIQLFLTSNQVKEVKKLCIMALQMMDDVCDLLRQLHQVIGDMEQAKSFAELCMFYSYNILELEPTRNRIERRVETMIPYSSLCAELGEYEEAAHYLANAIKMCSPELEITLSYLYRLIKLLHMQGKVDEILQILDIHYENMEIDNKEHWAAMVWTIQYKAYVLIEEGKIDDAEEILLKAKVEFNNYTLILTSLINFYHNHGSLEDADEISKLLKSEDEVVSNVGNIMTSHFMGSENSVDFQKNTVNFTVIVQRKVTPMVLARNSDYKLPNGSYLEARLVSDTQESNLWSSTFNAEGPSIDIELELDPALEGKYIEIVLYAFENEQKEKLLTSHRQFVANSIPEQSEDLLVENSSAVEVDQTDIEDVEIVTETNIEDVEIVTETNTEDVEIVTETDTEDVEIVSTEEIVEVEEPETLDEEANQNEEQEIIIVPDESEEENIEIVSETDTEDVEIVSTEEIVEVEEPETLDEEANQNEEQEIIIVPDESEEENIEIVSETDTEDVEIVSTEEIIEVEEPETQGEDILEIDESE
eukprot:TRINITY_DN806_c0_g1_i1.p1 TRINITY_DN806_c0_g1~~TRINITY_DN806_c0_g1_i1.p1  ORF type:complete len:684 (-),score=240.34 TRINITY_DN806_c0_g1_i1:542-2593(-)